MRLSVMSRCRNVLGAKLETVWSICCVLFRNVLCPSYASKVGRALMRALRRWQDEFGVQWYAALKIWAGVARLALSACLDCRAIWLLHTMSWRPFLMICLSKPHLREFEGGGRWAQSVVYRPEEACVSMGQGQGSHSIACAGNVPMGN